LPRHPRTTTQDAIRAGSGFWATVRTSPDFFNETTNLKLPSRRAVVELRRCQRLLPAGANSSTTRRPASAGDALPATRRSWPKARWRSFTLIWIALWASAAPEESATAEVGIANINAPATAWVGRKLRILRLDLVKRTSFDFFDQTPTELAVGLAADLQTPIGVCFQSVATAADGNTPRSRFAPAGWNCRSRQWVPRSLSHRARAIRQVEYERRAWQTQPGGSVTAVTLVRPQLVGSTRTFRREW
jgi:hypothetical protein